MIKQFIKNIFEAIGAKFQPVELEVPIKLKKTRIKPGKVKSVAKVKVSSTPKKKSAKK